MIATTVIVYVNASADRNEVRANKQAACRAVAAQHLAAMYRDPSCTITHNAAGFAVQFNVAN